MEKDLNSLLYRNIKKLTLSQFSVRPDENETISISNNVIVKYRWEKISSYSFTNLGLRKLRNLSSSEWRVKKKVLKNVRLGHKCACLCTTDQFAQFSIAASAIIIIIILITFERMKNFKTNKQIKNTWN